MLARAKVRLVVVAVLVLAACAKAPPTLSPAGARAFHATRVVAALDVLRDTAIAAEAVTPKLLSTESTRHVVLWHRIAVSTAAATPDGWQATIVRGLDEVLAKLETDERLLLEPYVALARALLIVSASDLELEEGA